MSHFNIQNLGQAFRQLDGNRAVGIDGITNYSRTHPEVETQTEEPDA